jgi:hypothetical protein
MFQNGNWPTTLGVSCPCRISVKYFGLCMGFMEKSQFMTLHELGLLWVNMAENRNLRTTFLLDVSDIDVEQFTGYVKKYFHGLTQTWVYYDLLCLEIRIANTV